MPSSRLGKAGSKDTSAVRDTVRYMQASSWSAVRCSGIPRYRQVFPVLLICELSALAVGQKHWRGVCLKASNSLGLARLTDRIHRHTDPHRDGHGLHVSIHRD
jgi:hypothetical protein